MTSNLKKPIFGNCVVRKSKKFTSAKKHGNLRSHKNFIMPRKY